MRAAAHGEGKYKGTPILSLLSASVHSSRRFCVLAAETCNVVWQSLHTAGLEVIARQKKIAHFTSPAHPLAFISPASTPLCCICYYWPSLTHARTLLLSAQARNTRDDLTHRTTHDLERSLNGKITSLYHPALVNGVITSMRRQRTNLTVLN